MSKVLGTIICKNQVVFIPGQKIQKYILVAYELIRGYSRKGGMPRCMVQIDIMKAYNSVDWHAMQTILAEVGFPRRFIKWVMLAVTSFSYQFNINEMISMSMKATRRLRQGDLISPLIFLVIMDYLHRELAMLITKPDFNFHNKCEKLNLVNLSYVNDLSLFSRGIMSQ